MMYTNDSQNTDYDKDMYDDPWVLWLDNTWTE